jgi:nicotinamide mononucleotide transporter
VTAQVLLSRKVLENWIFWIAVDALAVGVYASQGLHLTAALYGALLAMASWGLWEWRRPRT